MGSRRRVHQKRASKNRTSVIGGDSAYYNCVELGRLTNEGNNMNKISVILNQISDADLILAMREIKSTRETGIIPRGVIARLAQNISADLGIESHYAIPMVVSGLSEIAAFKWAGI